MATMQRSSGQLVYDQAIKLSWYISIRLRTKICVGVFVAIGYQQNVQ